MTGELADCKDDLYAEAECAAYPAYRTRGARGELDKTADYLIGAERPIIIAGGGANHSQAGHTIANLAEWLSIPVVTTISGQGLIADDHRLALGVIGDNGFHPHAHQAVEEGDVLLYVGCKMGSVSTINWSMPSCKPERKIIQINLNPEMLGNNFQNTLSIAGDARLIIEDLSVLIQGKTPRRTESARTNRLNLERARFWEAAESEFVSDKSPLKPQRIIAALNKRMPRVSVVIADAGTPTPYTTRYLKLRGNGSRLNWKTVWMRLLLRTVRSSWMLYRRWSWISFRRFIHGTGRPRDWA